MQYLELSYVGEGKVDYLDSLGYLDAMATDGLTLPRSLVVPLREGESEYTSLVRFRLALREKGIIPTEVGVCIVDGVRKLAAIGITYVSPN